MSLNGGKGKGVLQKGEMLQGQEKDCGWREKASRGLLGAGGGGGGGRSFTTKKMALGLITVTASGFSQRKGMLS